MILRYTQTKMKINQKNRAIKLIADSMSVNSYLFPDRRFSQTGELQKRGTGNNPGSDHAGGVNQVVRINLFK